MLDGSASITVNGQSVDIDSVATSDLGETISRAATYALSDLKAGGSLNIVNGDLSVAQEVLNQARSDIARQRGELGAFTKYNIGSYLSSLSVTTENIAAAESSIRDTDYASETSNLARLNILVQASLESVRLSGAQQVNILNLLA